MRVSRWEKKGTRCPGDAYIWAVLSQGAQDLSNTLVLTLIIRDHLDGAGVLWAGILEGSQGLVTLLNLGVQGSSECHGGKGNDSDATHIEYKCRVPLVVEKIDFW